MPPPAAPKAPSAFRTIGEVARETGVAQHVLRYWETRFPQLKPVTRAGNRRYYRPEDVALVVRLDTLLNRDGYTVRGVQQLLAKEKGAVEVVPAPEAPSAPASPAAPNSMAALRAIRDLLAYALYEDAT